MKLDKVQPISPDFSRTRKNKREDGEINRDANRKTRAPRKKKGGVDITV